MKQNNLTLGSLFDGSGGFPLGGLISGITPLWASEIEPFPVRVTTKRLPQMEHLGDITILKGSELPLVDIITFGSPCQDMSVAGKRDGLDGSRSSLFYEAIRIVKEMREKTNGKYPRFIVWENVPGAFSSNKGEDFRAVLQEICKVKDPQVSVPKAAKWENAGHIMADNYSVAWRLFDSQFWGVPQRRKRIYLVADFDGECAGKILFESEGLSWDFKKSGCPWKETTGHSAESFGEPSCYGVDGYNSSMDIVEATLGVNCGMSTGRNAVMVQEPMLFENHSQDTRYKGPLEVAQTVSSTYGMGGNNQPFVVQTPKTLKIRSGCEGGGKGALVQENLSATLGCNNDQTLFQPKAYGVCSKDSNAMKSGNPYSGFYEAETARCLDANGGNPSCNQGGMAVVSLQGSMIGRKDTNGPQGDGVSEDVSFTLNTVDKHAVVYAIDREAFNCGQKFARTPGITDNGISSTLNAQGPSAVAVPTFSSSKASFFTMAEEELANTLVATDYKDPPIVNDGDSTEYIVRRLTPTECARLQGFPDWWCSELETKEPTEEEIEKWRKIFSIHAKAMGKSSKPKSDNQIRKWLQDPHTDSAEYKMWGNGVALPNVVFVLSGIAHYAQETGENAGR